MNPEPIALTCASKSKAIHFTLGLMGHRLKVHLRQPHHLILTMRLKCILSLGFDVNTVLAACGKNMGLQTLDIPDENSKMGGFVPLDRPA